MKKKGFTLIELLAVIVVLAIIALIATPIVMNTIKRVQKGSAERSVDSYIKQVETVAATERLDGNTLEGEYEITSDGNICRDKKASCSDENKIIIDIKGTKPKSGKVTISNGNVEISEKITIGTFDVVYNSTLKSYEATEKGSSSTDDGTSILCKAVTTATTGNVPSGSFNYGDEYICNLGNTDDSKNLTFFVLDKTDTDVSLIMNKNLGDTVAWSEDDNNHKDDESKQAMVAKSALNKRTLNWTKLNQTQITLPSGQQIATSGGDTKWTDSIYGTGFSDSKWLYDNLIDSYDYWTSTVYSKNSTESWSVNSWGELGTNEVNNQDNIGVRPVITILKSQLS